MAKDASVAPGRTLVVGLGNPGPKYAGTRHNIGFDVADEFARRFHVDLSTQKFKALLGTGNAAGRSVSVLLPQTYMNRSGESVSPAASFWKTPVDGIVVIHDDLDLPFGRIRLKQGGGHGGHNGLRSLDQQLPSKNYFRIRMGIGRPERGDVTGWVLGRWSAEESTELGTFIDRGADAVELLLSEGLLAAQNEIHGGS